MSTVAAETAAAREVLPTADQHPLYKHPFHTLIIVCISLGVIAHHFPPVNGDNALADSINHALVVSRDDDGRAELVYFLQYFHHLIGIDGVEVPCRLIGDDEVRLIDNRAADADALFLAARELVGEMSGLIGEIYQFKDVGHVARNLVVGAAHGLHREGDVLIGGLIGDETEVLEDHTDSATIMIECRVRQVVDVN